MREFMRIVESQGIEVPIGNDAFKRWFGGSKVAGPDGRPMIVYHGTGHDFEAFDPDRDPYTYETDRGKFFFTNQHEEAEEYSKSGDSWGAYQHNTSRVISAYVSLQNPFIIDNADSPVEEWDSWGALYTKEAVENGHDGIIIHTEDAHHWLVVAFKPEQIKSVDNRGTFDPASPNFRD